MFAIGSFLYSAHGFLPIALATILIPLINLLLVASLDHVPGSPHARPAVLGVLGAVWLPGLGLALSKIRASNGWAGNRSRMYCESWAMHPCS